MNSTLLLNKTESLNYSPPRADSLIIQEVKRVTEERDYYFSNIAL